MSFTQEDINEFKAEALEFLDSAEKSLLSLDTGNDFLKVYDVIFRCFHNLKGGAGMMELVDLQNHIHELETDFTSLKAIGQINKNQTNFFLKGIDAARAIIDDKKIQFDYNFNSLVDENTTEPSNLSALSEYFLECEEITTRFCHSIELFENANISTEQINSVYRDMHSLKGAAYLFGFKGLGDLAHEIESFLDFIRADHVQLKKAHADLLFKSLDAAEKEIEQQKKGSSGKVALEQTKQIIAEINKEVHILLKAQQDSNTKNKEASPAQSVQSVEVQSSNEQNVKESEQNTSIRVPISLLDKLMTLTGEMVLVRNQVLQFSNKLDDPDFVNMSKRLNLVTSEVQSEMMKTRMQPIGNITNKYNRVVRDLAQELQKNITISVTGAETEIDKSLLEAIRDPITHIVRNACDHGIETTDERKANQKSLTGQIEIRSYHEDGQVIIEIRDDGRGLDRKKLVKKAVEKGLFTEIEAQNLSDKEAYDLIFYPGFSTAKIVTNLSGRGVGMDVVKTNVEKIGGSLDLSSELGVGTCIKMKIPLTLAIIPALIVKGAENYYSIPQIKLVELIRVDEDSKNKIEELHNTSVYKLRGALLPLLDLCETLNVNKAVKENQNKVIAVLSADNMQFGLIVDDVCDTADIVVKPLNKILKSLQVYSGATVLGDGSISLILDVQGLAKVGFKKRDFSARSSVTEMQNANEAQGLQKQDYLLLELNSPTKHAVVLEYVKRIEQFKRSQIEFAGKQAVVRYRDSVLPLISVNSFLEYENNNQVDEVITVIVVEKAGKPYGLEVNRIIDTLSTEVNVESSVKSQKGIVGHLNLANELVVVADPFDIIIDTMGLVSANHAFEAKQSVTEVSKTFSENKIK